MRKINLGTGLNLAGGESHYKSISVGAFREIFAARCRRGGGATKDF